MRFEETYEGWQANLLSQEEAATILGVNSRTFRSYTNRYDKEGIEGLLNLCLSQV